MFVSKLDAIWLGQITSPGTSTKGVCWLAWWLLGGCNYLHKNCNKLYKRSWGFDKAMGDGMHWSEVQSCRLSYTPPPDWIYICMWGALIINSRHEHPSKPVEDLFQWTLLSHTSFAALLWLAFCCRTLHSVQIHFRKLSRRTFFDTNHGMFQLYTCTPFQM